jgi:hypothetical protein
MNEVGSLVESRVASSDHKLLLKNVPLGERIFTTPYTALFHFGLYSKKAVKKQGYIL